MNKCIGFWTSKCTKPAQGPKKHMFWTSKCTKPAQGQKKQKFWTSKCTKPAQGQKKQKNKNFRGIVAPSQVDCEVFFLFLFFLSLCRFGALWSSKLLFFLSLCNLVHFEVQNLCFFVPVKVWPTLKSNTLSKTCTGTKKTHVLNFKVHQTCTGTKKTKVLNFKVHQTCTGTKKTKKTKTLEG